MPPSAPRLVPQHPHDASFMLSRSTDCAAPPKKEKPEVRRSLAADDANRCAEVDLSMAGWVSQGSEHLPSPGPAPAHALLCGRIAARKAVLVANPSPNPLCRMPLLDRSRLVGV